MVRHHNGMLARTRNVSTKQWLADNGIRKKAYYYRLHKFCREVDEEMQLPVLDVLEETSFKLFTDKRFGLYQISGCAAEEYSFCNSMVASELIGLLLHILHIGIKNEP